MTPDQALDLLADFAKAQSLSTQSRQNTERQIIQRLHPARQFDADRTAIRNAVARRSQGRTALLDEIQALVQALNSAVQAPVPSLGPPPEVRHATIEHVVEDQSLAQSINALIDALMNDNTTPGDSR
jgi:hypothetical protein